ncbi:MAG: TIM barrel protein [Cyclobacteriaceae bacterium]
MNRRDFLQTTSRAAMTLPFLHLPGVLKGMRMGIVVHSYGIRWNSKIESQRFPGFSNAIGLIEHCHKIGSGGVQVGVRNWSQDFAKKVRDRREKLGLFLEGSIGLPKNAGEVAVFEAEVLAGKEAGADLIRSVCLSGRRYENFHSLEEFNVFKKNSIAFLRLAEPVARKHKMKLAIENHKDWRATELVEILKNLGSEWVGATLDFGNNVALLEDPVEVAQTLGPYVFTTHVKDMGVDEYENGFLLSEVPLGTGFVDLKKIFAICKQHNPTVKFNLEMITRDPLKIPCLTDDFWPTFPDVTPQDLARTLRIVKTNPYKPALPSVSHLKDEERLEVEEQNILASLQYSESDLGMG